MLKGRPAFLKTMPPIPNINPDYTYDPTDITLFDGSRVKRDSPLGQAMASNFPTQAASRQAAPIRAGGQDADYYLPLSNLNKFLSGSNQVQVTDRKENPVARLAQPGQTIRYYDDYGDTSLGIVAKPTVQNPDSSAYTIANLIRPGSKLNISQLPPKQQARIAEQQDQYNYPVTDGEGYVGYKDHYLKHRSNPTAANQGEMPMLPGPDQYDPVITGWLNANIVNEDSRYLTPAQISTRGARKSRYENGQWVERPITESIQNLKPDFNQESFDKALAMGDDLGRFYQPGVTQSMLDADLPRTKNLLTEDQAIRQINAEQQNQLNSRNLESIEVYNKPQDLRPPSSARGADNYNLAYKYANTSDLLNLNDGYNQQWEQQIPKHYSDYSGGPIQYNDAGVAIGFGDRNLNPVTPLARGARNYLPISETYTSVPQYTYTERRNIVRLPAVGLEHPISIAPVNEFGLFAGQSIPAEVQRSQLAQSFIPTRQEKLEDGQGRVRVKDPQGFYPVLDAAKEQQQELRDNLEAIPEELGRGTYNDYFPVQTTGITLGNMPEVDRQLKASDVLKRFASNNFADDGEAITAAKGLTPDDYKIIAKSDMTPEQIINNTTWDGIDAREYLQDNLYIQQDRTLSAIPNAYLQYVDNDGNIIIDHETSKPKITPYTPSDNLNQRSDELSRVLIEGADRKMYPYVGVASEPLMSEGYTKNEVGDLIHKASNTELSRDPALLPDALNRIQQLKEEARILSGNVQRRGSTDPKSYLDKHIKVTDQAKHLENSYNALTAIDPDMNIDSQSFKVGVEMQQGQDVDKIAALLRNNDINPVIDGQEITGRGDLPIRQQAELGRDIRRSLQPEVEKTIVSADPEMDQLVQKWGEEREVVNQLKQRRRLNQIGRPVVDDKQVAINRLTNTIENADYQGKPVRQNLNFDPNDFDILSETVHPLDRIPVNNFQSQMAQANPGFAFTPSNADPIYTGFERAPAGKMVHAAYLGERLDPIPQQYTTATPGFEFNPNSAAPEYMGQQRPVRGNMTYVPQMVQEVASTGGMNRKALIGGGILGALTLGGLAYQNAKRQQDEQDAYEMQMRQMTGWR